MNTERILTELSALKISAEKDFSLEYSNSFRVKSVAALAVFPSTTEQLCKVLSLLDEKGIRKEVIGNGTNILFANEYFDGAVVFTRGMKGVELAENVIRADCGASLTSVAQAAARAGLSGLEFAYGIPATVGGAVYMNAGAYGGSVSDILECSRCFDGNRIISLSRDEHDFLYRKSSYMTNGFICVDAFFELNFGDRSEIETKMNENMRSRKEKQPLEFPNAGSYFKRPEGHFAGKLIEDCGLKGYRVGGAEVSRKHAGFVINVGGATADDILSIEEEIKRRVFEQFGVVLEREVHVIE